jgi:hypothetical protein
MPWLRRLVAGFSPRKPGSNSRPVCMGFVMEKVTLGEVFPPKYVGLSLSVSLHQCSILHSFVLRRHRRYVTKAADTIVKCRIKTSLSDKISSVIDISLYTTQFLLFTINVSCRWQCPRRLRRGSAAAGLRGLWIRIPPGVWISILSVVCCQVEVSATGWSLGQVSPTGCGVSECDREASIMRRSWPTRAVESLKKKRYCLRHVSASEGHHHGLLVVGIYCYEP